MKKFLLIFTAVTLLFFAIGSVSFYVNDKENIVNAINSEYGDESDKIWKYPIYDRIYQLNNNLNEFNSHMHEIKNNISESFK
ncbi:hypothetical protein [Ezakiella coagulans]|uniref:hypothetical protein n=1 Tax=Ezakiella coagulans TaxID=46507 RepID=UPI002889CCF4|nr:hypothetical protein [Ezakiella coagulans]